MIRRPAPDFLLAVAAMTLVVTASNLLVQVPVTLFGLQDYLTLGALSYPVAFLVTDASNRRFGARGARQVVYVGFALAVALSLVLATPRIALASGTAFLVAQLLDVAIFQRLRRQAWWVAPFASSVVSSGVDTLIFFALVFHCGPVLGGETISTLLGAVGIADTCTGLPWTWLAGADYLVKLSLAVLALQPYRLVLRFAPPQAA